MCITNKRNAKIFWHLPFIAFSISSSKFLFLLTFVARLASSSEHRHTDTDTTPIQNTHTHTHHTTHTHTNHHKNTFETQQIEMTGNVHNYIRDSFTFANVADTSFIKMHNTVTLTSGS